MQNSSLHIRFYLHIDLTKTIINEEVRYFLHEEMDEPLQWVTVKDCMQIFITEGNISMTYDENPSIHECNHMIQITKGPLFRSIIDN